MPTDTVQRISRAEVYHLVDDAITGGLPAPKQIRFYDDSIHIDLDSAADRAAWQPTFGLAGIRPNEQPHPLDVPPEQFERWITDAFGPWRGWWVTLHGEDPITGEQRAGWMSSGRAARRAEYVARISGHGYTRADEGDDPQPAGRIAGHVGESESALASNGQRTAAEPTPPVVTGDLTDDAAKDTQR